MRCHRNVLIIVAVLFFSLGILCAIFLPAVVLCVLLAILVVGGCIILIRD